MSLYSYSIVFVPCEEGGYNIIVPAITEICTHGDTMDEARAMATEAIQCYLESALETGEDIPADREPFIDKISVSI